MFSFAARAVMLTVVCGCALIVPIQAQEKDATTGKTAKTKAEPLPAVEQPELVTADGVFLHASYYPSTKGKESVPVILIHDFKESRKDLAALALSLQQDGYAVLVPDLRGHGESTRLKDSKKKLRIKAMPAAAFLPMVSEDMEACKKFLLKENDAGKLNIDKLCLVGLGMGSVVAIDYARADWSWPQLAHTKQGQDVKAVVLISPEWSFRALSMMPALEQPETLKQIAIMILVGQRDRKAHGEATRLHTRLKRSHPKADAKKLEERTLVYAALPTSLQGTKMLDVPALQVANHIKLFLKWRIGAQKLPWKKRIPLPQ